MRRATIPAVVALTATAKRDIFFVKRKHRYPTSAERAHAIMTAKELAVNASCPGNTFTIHQADNHLVEAAAENARRITEQQKLEAKK